MKTAVMYLLAQSLVTSAMLQGSLAQEISGCYPQVSNQTASVRTHMEEGIYLTDSYIFSCSGVIQTYSLTTYHDTSENELWENTLTSVIDILGLRTGFEEPVRLGRILVHMNHSDDDYEHEGGHLMVIEGKPAEEIIVQQGDYVRISTPRSLYSRQQGQFVNQHIPVALVASSGRNITRFFDCTNELSCRQVESLSRQVEISFTVDLQDTANSTMRFPTVVPVDPMAMQNVILISVIVILIILVVVLSVILTLLACKTKLKQSCFPPPKGRAEVHESSSVSALAIIKPRAPRQSATPSELQGTRDQDTADREYATLRGQAQLSGPAMQTGQLQPAGYDLPQRTSTELTVSQNSHLSQGPVPEFPAYADYEDIYTKHYYVPTMEQRNRLSNVGTADQYSMDSTMYETLWRQQEATPRVAPSRDADVYCPPSENEEEIYQQMAERKMSEIPRPLIKLKQELGKGEFGVVYRGLWYSQSGNKEVAVKVMRDESTDKDKIKILQEAVIMGQFSHQHVVKFYGILTLMEPVMMVMELLPNGDLRKHLMAIRADESLLTSPTLPSQLLKFCRQVTNGMDYLSRKGFVHRDLAARNILLDKDFNCKIADFGMSRVTTESGYYVTRGGQIPVKWTAPEAILFRKYSTSSDVWSLGMVLFEVWSLGWKPFDNFNIDQVIQIFSTGYCQPPPPGTPRGVYNIMVQCWNPEAHDRPSFDLLCSLLNQHEERLLHWSSTDKEAAREDGAKLGAALIESLELYPELQYTYRKP